MKTIVKKVSDFETAAVLATLTTMSAVASADNFWDTAVTELGGLKTGVIAVGGVILGIAVTKVGFYLFKNMANRAS